MRLFALLAIFALSPALSHAADGARVFQLQCRACHGPASTAMGPALNGVAAAKIAGRSDFAYSKALSGKAGTWTDAALDAYLAAPLKFAPGGRMSVAVANPGDRAAVIAYLKTLN